MNRGSESETPGSAEWFTARCEERRCQHIRTASNLPHAIYGDVPIEVLQGCTYQDCKAGQFNCLSDDLKEREAVCAITSVPVVCGKTPTSARKCLLCGRVGKI